jgi:hypothetical protein
MDPQTVEAVLADWWRRLGTQGKRT